MKTTKAFLTLFAVLHWMAMPAAEAQPASGQEAQTIAQEAYIYLYPLVTMDVTRRQFLNLDSKTSAFGGPANAFTHIRAFPTAEMRAVVRPNFDTLYSSAWLDLTGGPVIVSTADTGGRYFLLPMLARSRTATRSRRWPTGANRRAKSCSISIHPSTPRPNLCVW